jgi:uncharacterized protein YeaO (DUF488 family)
MAIRVVRLGTARGVPKSEHAARDFYDVWLPDLAPSEALVKRALAARGEREWRAFERRYRAELKKPPAARLLDLLAALSRQAAFSVGCYCEDESRCHRSILKAILEEHGARLA